MDTGPDTAGRPTDLESGALISEMRGRIEDLREQLQAERQAHAEARSHPRHTATARSPRITRKPRSPTPTDAGEGPQAVARGRARAGPGGEVVSVAVEERH
jgi:hypothetical protein